MKQWILVLMLGVALTACKEDIDLYEGTSSVWFDDNSSGDYEVAWGTIATDVKKMDISLRVNLFGNVTDYPRKFNVRVLSDPADSLYSEAGVDYMPFPLEYEMPAGENHTFIHIELLRTDTLKKQARRFTVQLVPNDEFGLEYMNWDEVDGELVMTNDHCTIWMNEDFPRPWWWHGIGEPIFGEWSQTKGILICDVGKIDREKFQGEVDSGDDNLTSAFLRFVGRKVYLYLQENPTPDEDGELMKMGEQSSY